MDLLKSIVMPVVVALLSAGIASYITIKLKFAQDEKAAFRSIRVGLLRFASYVFNILNLLLLIREVASADPVTRFTVLTISILIAALLFAIVGNLLSDILKQLGQILVIQKDHITLMRNSCPPPKDEHK